MAESITLNRAGFEKVIARVCDATDKIRMPESYKAGIYRGVQMVMRSLQEDLGLSIDGPIAPLFRETMHLRDLVADELGARIPEDDGILP
jgi:hypothetical protein